MDRKDKPMIPAQTAQETEQAEAARGEALNDEELDAVAGGDQISDWIQDQFHIGGNTGWHHGGTAAYTSTTAWYDCNKCGGTIIPGHEKEHICIPEKDKIRD